MYKPISHCITKTGNAITDDEQNSLLMLGILNAVFAFPTITLNTLVILSINLTPGLHKPSYFLLMNLGLADLSIGMLVLPLQTALSQFYSSGNRYLYCYTRSVLLAIMVTAGSASILTVTAIAIDRYLAIRLKMRYRTNVTIKRVKNILALIWVLSISIASFPFYIPLTSVCMFAAVGVSACLLITVICYSMSFRALGKHCTQIHAHDQQLQQQQQQQQHQQQQKQYQKQDQQQQQQQQEQQQQQKQERQQQQQQQQQQQHDKKEQQQQHHDQEQHSYFSCSTAIDIEKYRKLLITMLIILISIVVCYSVLVLLLGLLFIPGQNKMIIWSLVCVVGLNPTFNPVICFFRLKDLQTACRQTVRRYVLCH